MPSFPPVWALSSCRRPLSSSSAVRLCGNLACWCAEPAAWCVGYVYLHGRDLALLLTSGSMRKVQKKEFSQSHLISLPSLSSQKSPVHKQSYTSTHHLFEQFTQTMDRQHEPAWLRTYKTRAAPFSPVHTRIPTRNSPSPRPLRVHERPRRRDRQQDVSVLDEENNFSVAFPSTISLGLKSFGLFAQPHLESSIHPALRSNSGWDSGNDGSSDTSSMRTKVEGGYRPQHNEKFKDRRSVGWRRRMRRLVRRLLCDMS